MNGPRNIVLRDAQGSVAQISTYDVRQSNGVIDVVGLAFGWGLDHALGHRGLGDEVAGISPRHRAHVRVSTACLRPR